MATWQLSLVLGCAAPRAHALSLPTSLSCLGSATRGTRGVNHCLTASSLRCEGHPHGTRTGTGTVGTGGWPGQCGESAGGRSEGQAPGVTVCAPPPSPVASAASQSEGGRESTSWGQEGPQ